MAHELICAQAMRYFGMTTKADNPTRHQWAPLENATRAVKEGVGRAVLDEFLVDHHYGEFSFDLCGVDHMQEDGEPDEMFNYCSQFCIWALHILHMEDTAKEGDFDRLVANLKFNCALFYTHSKRSHYLGDCLDFIMKTQYLLSPQESLRVLEGAFMNPTGKPGRNIESDLKVEHTVRTRKNLIRGLGANKSERAILRATGAADMVDQVIEANDAACDIPARGNRHTRASTEADKNRVAELIHELEPFHHTPGRRMPGCCRESLTLSPFALINKDAMIDDVNIRIQRIIDGVGAEFDDDADAIDSSDDEGDLLMP